MAIKRLWATVTPAGKPLVQAAIDLAGYGGEIADSSWAPYPDLSGQGTVKLYWTGWQGDEVMHGLLGTLILGVTGALGVLVGRVRQGPVRPSNPQLTRAQAEAQFPLPNIGPPAGTIMSLNAAIWLHYRDFLLLPYDDIGLPNIIGSPLELTARVAAGEAPAVATEEEPPATEPAAKKAARKKTTKKAEPTE
jgi:hypothetical protein